MGQVGPAHDEGPGIPAGSFSVSSAPIWCTIVHGMASGTPNARITVSLIPKAEDALTSLHTTTGMSKSDLVNRAIQVYNFLQTVETGQGQLLVHWPDGNTKQVQFL